MFAQAWPSGATIFHSTPHCQVACLGGLLVLTTVPIGPCQVHLVTIFTGASRASSTRSPIQYRSCGRHCVAAFHTTAGFLFSPWRPLGRVKSSIQGAPLSGAHPPLLIFASRNLYHLRCLEVGLLVGLGHSLYRRSRWIRLGWFSLVYP